MLFSSITFLFRFLPAVLILYLLVPSAWRNVLLLAASLFFYAWGEPIYIILMILSILFNYVSGLDLAQKLSDRKKALHCVFFSIGVNLFLLGFFKYYGFILDILNQCFKLNLEYRELSLPIGISFYTFQAISYLIDVYRNDAKPQRNLIHFALYISMFPQLIAGPIVRYNDIEAQLANREFTIRSLGHGARYFIRGLAKKAILANGIGQLFQLVLAQVEAGSASTDMAWLGAVSYMLQIYFDFSGYSDMAIGLGCMFGFQFPANFEHPYVSRSVTEFWRRWHISLSTWFREYLYIPLGGNRVTAARHILNLLIVWTATGLWHGAAWNFVVWGLYYGILLILEKYVWGSVLEKMSSIVQHAYTLLAVLIGWVFFFSSSLSAAWEYLKIMAGIGASGLFTTDTLYLIRSNWLILLLGILCSAYSYSHLARILERKQLTAWIPVVLETMVFLLAVSCLITDTFNPFLYFRF